MAARLECHVEGGADRVLVAGLERRDLGVRGAKGRVVPLPQDLSIANDDGADERVRARVPPAMLGQLYRSPDVLRIVVGQKLPPARPIDILVNRRPERR
jgi:hypothetical protein